jgi:hypothetical protein
MLSLGSWGANYKTLAIIERDKGVVVGKTGFEGLMM